MPIAIPNYSILEMIYEGNKVLVYRAIRLSDNFPVIIKVLNEKHSSKLSLYEMKAEYEITKKINCRHVVKAYALEQVNNRTAMILEDFGGESLRSIIKSKKFDLSSVLMIGIQCAEALGEIHNLGISHQDITPNNIILNLDEHLVKIANFGLATHLENHKANIIQAMQRDIRYMSPEQFGITNRYVDNRTDFYSLGVVLYEILTGQLPFQAKDKSELLYQYIAKYPTPPDHLDKEIPEPLSSIILKCLSKNSEDRYESAYGLKSDLEECRNQYMHQGRILAFPLGGHDNEDHFRFPQKLYGRSKETAKLVEIFKHICDGEGKILSLSGNAGIGKSSLAHEIQRFVLQKKGFFIEGHCHPIASNRPFSCFIEAFRDLILQLQLRSKPELELWRSRILKAVVPYGEIICKLIPELEQIIGKQPPVTALPILEASHRFKAVFSNFIEVFLQKEHPLVILFDDFQWAYPHTLAIIEEFMSEASRSYLLIICSYRDDEFQYAQTFYQMIERLRYTQRVVERLTLGPLNITSINEWLRDAFKCPIEKIEPLSLEIYKKSQGNPLYISEYLKWLINEDLAQFNFERKSWQVDVNQIFKQTMPNNVLDLITARLQKLQPQAQNLISIGSAVGTTFSLQTIARVCNVASEKSEQLLFDALQAGFIGVFSGPIFSIQSNNEEDVDYLYTFLQLPFHQAAYEQIPAHERHQLHLRIAQTILKGLPFDEFPKKALEITSHLNIGSKYIIDNSEKNEAIQLNLIAGERALEFFTYFSAASCFTAGINLLNEDRWKTQYDISYRLYKNLLLCEYLLDHRQEGDILLNEIIKNVKNPSEKCEILVMRINFLAQDQQFEESLKRGVEALKSFDVELSFPPVKLDILYELLKMKIYLSLHSIDSIERLPFISDEKAIAISRIYHAMWPAVFQLGGRIQDYISLKSASQAIKSGIGGYNLAALVSFGIRLASERMQKYIEGYRFGFLALNKLQSASPSIEQSSAAALFAVFLNHWKEPLSICIDHLKDEHRHAIELGNMMIGLKILSWIPIFQLLNGEYLDNIHEEALKNLHQIIKNQEVLPRIEICLGVCLALKGFTPDPCDPSPKHLKNFFKENQKSTGHESTYFVYHTWRFFLLYIHEKYELALELVDAFDAYSAELLGDIHWLIFHYYHALTLAAVLMPNNTTDIKYKTLKQLQKRIKKWADASPNNYQQKYLLLSAEVARVEGNSDEAIDLYEKSIMAAEKSQNLLDIALTHELAANFYLDLGKTKFSMAYLLECYHAYAMWGATSKLNILREKHGQALSDALRSKQGVFKDLFSAISPLEPSQRKASEPIISNAPTILHIAQILSAEVVLERLLSKLVHILLVNSGADKVLILLKNKERLFIQAEIFIGQKSASLMEGLSIEEKQDQLCLAIVHQSVNNLEKILLNDATHDADFSQNPYIKSKKPQSILCIPLVHRGDIIGVIYLENQLSKGAFTHERLQLLTYISNQTSISIKNALFYSNLEENMEERSKEISQLQSELIQQEKMASLGLLTAGIAHEIKNPLSFIINFSELSQGLIQELDRYYDQYKEKIKAEDKDDIQGTLLTLTTNIENISEQGKRADTIVRRMLSFASDRRDEFVPVNVHSLIDDSLVLSYHGMRSINPLFTIFFVKNYDSSMPEVYAAPHELSRVFLNILNNAYYVLMEKKGDLGEAFVPSMEITTHNLESRIEIHFKDNGKGISKELAEKIFTPFFTTKPEGKGTGLGLSMSYNIITKQHNGTIRFDSKEGEYADFIITLPKSMD